MDCSTKEDADTLIETFDGAAFEDHVLIVKPAINNKDRNKDYGYPPKDTNPGTYYNIIV